MIAITQEALERTLAETRPTMQRQAVLRRIWILTRETESTRQDSEPTYSKTEPRV